MGKGWSRTRVAGGEGPGRQRGTSDTTRGHADSSHPWGQPLARIWGARLGKAMLSRRLGHLEGRSPDLAPCRGEKLRGGGAGACSGAGLHRDACVCPGVGWGTATSSLDGSGGTSRSGTPPSRSHPSHTRLPLAKAEQREQQGRREQGGGAASRGRVNKSRQPRGCRGGVGGSDGGREAAEPRCPAGKAVALPKTPRWASRPGSRLIRH